MSWTIKIKTEKEVTKYRIWTTVSDGWITEWLTREEMVKFHFWNQFKKFMDSFIEDAMTFPNNYYDKDTEKRYMDVGIQESFTSFMYHRHDDGKDYMQVTADKFGDLLTSSGIEMKISDVDGYGFESKG